MINTDKYCLMVVYDSIEGDGRCLRQIETLADNGYKLVVLAINVSSFYVNPYCSIRSVKIRKGNLGWIQFVLFVLYYILKNRKDISFLYLLNHYMTIVGWVSKKLFKLNWIYDAYENLIPAKRYSKGGNEKILYLLERLSIGTAGLVVAANYERARLLKWVYKLKNVTYVANIINPVNLPDFQCPSEPQGKNDEFIVLYQGYLSEERNIELFIRTISELPSNFKLKIIGGGIAEKKLIHLVKTLNIDNRVFFLGYLPYKKMFEESVNAKLGIVYYKSWNLNTYYCSPNKIYEYSNLHIPILSSDQLMFRRIFSRYKVGEWLASDMEPKEVAAIILNIYKNYRCYTIDFDRFNSDFNYRDEGLRLIEAMKEITVFC